MQDTFFIMLDSCILAVCWQLSHFVCASYFVWLFGLLGLHTCLMGWHAVTSGLWSLGFPMGGCWHPITFDIWRLKFSNGLLKFSTGDSIQSLGNYDQAYWHKNQNTYHFGDIKSHSRKGMTKNKNPFAGQAKKQLFDKVLTHFPML